MLAICKELPITVTIKVKNAPAVGGLEEFIMGSRNAQYKIITQIENVPSKIL